MTGAPVPQIGGALAERLRTARRVVVLTGAGASAESGIPTFRDALTGLWERYDPAQLATPEAFAADPDLVWGWYEWRRALVARCRPNPGHSAIARLQREVGGRGGSATVVTQNVDDLHERAGSDGVIHLHGAIAQSRCAECGAAVHEDAVATVQPPEHREGAQDGEGRRVPPPRCTECGGPVRPAIVWFGEALPRVAWHRAEEAAASADVLLSVGTSSTVYPAAELPHIARRAGARVVQVNPSPTGLEPVVHDDLRGPSGTVLPALVDAAFGSAAR